MHLFPKFVLAALGATGLVRGQTLREALAEHENLSTLLGLLDDRADFAANLAALEGLTIFAPSNDAEDFSRDRYTDSWAQHFEQELRYHILDGQPLSSGDILSEERFYPTLLLPDGIEDPLEPAINRTLGQGARVGIVVEDEQVAITGSGGPSFVTEADIMYDNGIIHIIDRLLLPPAPLTQRLVNLSPPLLEAINVTNLTETLDGPGLTAFTVFVPNEQAFEALGSALHNVSDEQLARIVEYHSVLGEVVFSYQLSNGQELRPAGPEGNALTVSIDDDDQVFINGAQIVESNLLQRNGVIHILDGVLNPDASTANGSVQSPSDLETEAPSDFTPLANGGGSVIVSASSEATGAVSSPTTPTSVPAWTATSNSSSTDAPTGDSGDSDASGDADDSADSDVAETSDNAAGQLASNFAIALAVAGALGCAVLA